MADLFTMDAKDLIKLRRFYKKAPKAFKKAAAGTLNAFAFSTRRKAIDIIHAKMTVRNQKFIDGSIKVEKAQGNVLMKNMQSETGSVPRPRYTGLREQEMGESGARNRVFTKSAREGSRQAVTKGYARLKPNADYPSPSKERLSGLSGAKRIVAFLHILSETKRAQTFILRKQFGRFKRGLYRFKQGKIKKLQAFDTKRRPRRIRWLTGAREAVMTKVNIAKAWAESIEFQLKKLR
jgi:hypothetical protein